VWKRLHVKYPSFFSDFNETWIFLTYFLKKKAQISSLIKIRPVGANLFHANRQNMKIIVAFRNFAKAHKKIKNHACRVHNPSWQETNTPTKIQKDIRKVWQLARPQAQTVQQIPGHLQKQRITFQKKNILAWTPRYLHPSYPHVWLKESSSKMRMGTEWRVVSVSTQIQLSARLTEKLTLTRIGSQARSSTLYGWKTISSIQWSSVWPPPYSVCT
jgi:hypothetical protein